MRKPLPGWMRAGGYFILGTVKAGTIAYACNGAEPGYTGRMTLGVGENRVWADDLRSAQLAAEDAARALAADIVAALGGTVAWPESEAPDA